MTSPTTNPLAPAWLRVPADANSLDPAIWPGSATRRGGELTVGGIRASELAATYGTPVYVVDEADARRRAAEILGVFTDAFAGIGTTVKVYYAAKAFLSVGVARWMQELGLRLDVASDGEFAVALAAGFDPARIGYHGNNKSVREIEAAVEAGVGSIILDNRAELDHVLRAARERGVRQGLRIRVNSGVHASTHEFLATAREDQKFGLPVQDIPEIVAAIRAEPNLTFLGLHSHIGSQIFDTAGFGEAARRLLELQAELLEGGPVPELNLGGGFGIAYTVADDPAPIGDIARGMAEIVGAECARLGIPVPVVAIEPGRSIIGPAGVTLYEAGTIKDVRVETDGGSAVRRYVSVDGGMSDNPRPELYGAEYSVRIASRESSAEPALVRVAGKHCESGDIVVNADYLPGDVRTGDLLAVPATGAYCWSLASNYNHLGRPPVVAVRDGSSRLLVRGETIADLLRRDADATPAAQEAP
ncbi:diaminopimelate decarboxylase [Naasia sp. SYSU D00057]|uniref:diaminopimelate decarboxylase n=1 Tax=Naasia sp. SYSU D00057 TaxID=2817380 RepID=UPI001B30027D|nr:diaminopimelate decarboxylase [Naasia sp. SYSU D00057]